MKQYLDLLDYVLTHGTVRPDRTGTGTISVFAPPPMRFNLQEGFPLVTTRKIFTKGIIHELLWFLSGDTNTKYLEDNSVTIWREWTLEDGTIGRGYQAQWRGWDGLKCSLPSVIKHKPLTGGSVTAVDGSFLWKRIDQIEQVIRNIKTNPFSRRHLISAWNVGELDQMALPPCHYAFQFYVGNDLSNQPSTLSCSVQIRSNDIFLGNCWNVPFYALLTHMVAQVTGLKPGELIINIGDAHIYLNHIEQVKLQLTRQPLPLPTLWLNPDITDIDDFRYEDIKVLGYQSHPAIKGEISV